MNRLHGAKLIIAKILRLTSSVDIIAPQQLIHIASTERPSRPKISTAPTCASKLKRNTMQPIQTILAKIETSIHDSYLLSSLFFCILSPLNLFKSHSRRIHWILLLNSSLDCFLTFSVYIESPHTYYNHFCLKTLHKSNIFKQFYNIFQTKKSDLHILRVALYLLAERVGLEPTHRFR